MAAAAQSRRLVRFGVFEADLRTCELRKSGLKVKLADQPFQVLAMLLEHPGELVTREELQKKLWSESTFVDFEHGLNKAVNRIREALGDDADNPRFVETLPRRGYRFIYPVAPASSPAESVAAISHRHILDGDVKSPLRKRIAFLVAAPAAIIIVAALALNLASLRERVMRAVAAVSDRRTAMRTSPLQKIESIAVLPLENLSGDPEQEYFADGMTEALISDLGKISSLRVISRTSAMHYKGTKKRLPEIARELNVDAVVEGSVLRSGDRVRIRAQLIQAKPEKHLWAETYDRDLRDVLALQSDVTRAIGREIQVRLTPQEQTRLATTRPVKPEAYEAYLRGRYFWSRTPQRLQDCIRSFQQATDIDPTFAPAHAGQSLCYSSLGFFEPPKEISPKARAAATKALEMDGTLAEAHLALSEVKKLFDWDWHGAEKELKRAIELNSSSSDARWLYSDYLGAMGRFEEALAEAKQALELDPLSLFANAAVGNVYQVARRYDEAIVHYRKAVELDPGSGYAPGLIHWCLILKGDYAAAFEEFQKIGMPRDNATLGYLYGVSGQPKKALRVAQELERLSRKRYVNPVLISIPYVGLGDKERAFYWLTRSYEEGSAAMFQLKTIPWFDPLRSDPRFQDLLPRMNFPP